MYSALDLLFRMNETGGLLLIDFFKLPYCLAWLLLVVVQDNHL
jgi:hypothetical protein